MKKLIILILILASTFTFGCNKTEDSSVVKLNKVDISALSNKKLKNIIYSEDLKQGIYKITTNKNIYIYFLGEDKEFTSISCSLEDKALNITASLVDLDSDDISRKLFVIYEKNSTASGNKAEYFEDIKLIVDDKEEDFKDSFTI